MTRDDLKDWVHIRPGYWFAPKLFGWGATPVTRRGWLVTAAFIAVLVAIQTGTEGAARWIASILAISGFIAIVWKKTDGAWKWRWGSVDR
ncbi:MAG: hypothetical protein OSB00_08705 [Sphingomonas bacterium]|nr:hypothetical protein [Sphingomonas bacterium]